MFVGLLLVSLLSGPHPIAISVESCAVEDYSCAIGSSGTFIDLGRVKPGIPGYGISPPSDSDGDPFMGAGNPGNSGAPVNPPVTLCNTDDDTFPINDPLQGICQSDDVVEIPYPTLADLARFTPQPPTLTGEPYTAGVIGKPTNFLSTASTHTLTGALFGYPVSVQFTPVSYTFDYGDGTTATVTDAYDSWVDAGLPQFTPTDASHVYSAKGEFDVSVTVAYSATVNFTGSGAWLPVDGYVRATASGYDVTIYEVVTALVDKDCNEDPNGIGCP